jgi:methylisocitrate lyase
VLPKKCGHLNDKRLIAPKDMAAKIAAATRARRHLYIVARTDAVANEGIDAAIKRARLYVEAGADAIFPEALTDREAFARFAKAIHVPLLANMTEFGRTPLMTAPDFEKLGYKMVIWPVSALRMAGKAYADLFAAIREDGGAHRLIDHMQTRAELYEAIGYHEYEALDSSIIASVAPEATPTANDD